MKFFTIRGPWFWGDCGTILTAGLASSRNRSASGRLLLQRTGPFVPPISFPNGNVVVTDEFRGMLESSEFGGFQYLEVEKDRIVELRWEQYDRNSTMPSWLESEVEGHVLFRRHSERLADSLGVIWEMELDRAAETHSIRNPNVGGSGLRSRGLRRFEVSVDARSWNGADFFRSSNQRHVVATERFAQWLLEHVADWVTRTPCVES